MSELRITNPKHFNADDVLFAICAVKDSFGSKYTLIYIDCGNGTKLVHDKSNGCPICIPIDSTNNEPCGPIACPYVLCRVGTVQVIDPTGCSCPKCVPEVDCDSPALPDPPCKPLICPLIFCDEGTIKLEDPLGCKCPVCLPLIGSSSESIGIISKPFSCKFLCPFLKCGQGEPANRYLCGCPKCEAIEGPVNITLPVKPICDIVCPVQSCPPGYFLRRPPGIGCACPRCVPWLLSRPPRCNGLTCPQILCPENQIRLEDPLGCRCPLCHPLPAAGSLESIQIPIQCKILCLPITCPPGQSPYRNPKALCGCPFCVPDNIPPPASILNDTICEFVCPAIKCPAGQLPLRDPRVKCECPKCHPIPTPCQPLACLHVECPVGTVKLEDPQGCRCPICHNITAEEADEGLIGAGILCDFICKPPTCPPGYFPERDPFHACGCKHCVLQKDLKIIPDLTFDFVCPSCPAGTFPYSDPGVRQGCPLCVPLNSTLISCQPRICPLIACENGTIKLEDPQGCRCPICHRPPDSSQEVVPRIPILCNFVCPPARCPPGEVGRRDPRYVCGCPKCYPADIITHIPDDIICEYACPPLICPEGQVATRTGKRCQCPICAPLQAE